MKVKLWVGFDVVDLAGLGVDVAPDDLGEEVERILNDQRGVSLTPVGCDRDVKVNFCNVEVAHDKS